jgi:hypothetical protein
MLGMLDGRAGRPIQYAPAPASAPGSMPGMLCGCAGTTGPYLSSRTSPPVVSGTLPPMLPCRGEVVPAAFSVREQPAPSPSLFASNLRRATLAPPQTVPRPTPKRINYDEPIVRDVMEEAIQTYLQLEPADPLNPLIQRGGFSREAWANSKGVKPQTFRDRLDRQDPLAVPRIGRPHLLKCQSEQAIVDGIRRHDQLGHGICTTSIVAALQETFPHLSKMQCDNVWQNTLKHKPGLTKSRSAEGISRARVSAVNEVDQRIWFALLEEERRQMAVLNTGLYKGHGWAHWHKLGYCIWGCDEECCLACATQKGMIGDSSLRRHLNKSQDNRASCTALRCGSAGPSGKGPSVYLTHSLPAFVNAKFLVTNGAPPGSQVFANASAYQTNETWDLLIEGLCKAVRAADEVLRANPPLVGGDACGWRQPSRDDCARANNYAREPLACFSALFSHKPA